MTTTTTTADWKFERHMIITLSDAIEKADVIRIEARLLVGLVHFVEISRETAREIAKNSNSLENMGERHYGLHGDGWTLERPDNNRGKNLLQPLRLTFRAK